MFEPLPSMVWTILTLLTISGIVSGQPPFYCQKDGIYQPTPVSMFPYPKNRSVIVITRGTRRNEYLIHPQTLGPDPVLDIGQDITLFDLVVRDDQSLHTTRSIDDLSLDVIVSNPSGSRDKFAALRVAFPRDIDNNKFVITGSVPFSSYIPKSLNIKEEDVDQMWAYQNITNQEVAVILKGFDNSNGLRRYKRLIVYDPASTRFEHSIEFKNAFVPNVLMDLGGGKVFAVIGPFTTIFTTADLVKLALEPKVPAAFRLQLNVVSRWLGCDPELCLDPYLSAAFRSYDGFRYYFGRKHIYRQRGTNRYNPDPFRFDILFGRTFGDRLANRPIDAAFQTVNNITFIFKDNMVFSSEPNSLKIVHEKRAQDYFLTVFGDIQAAVTVAGQPSTVLLYQGCCWVNQYYYDTEYNNWAPAQILTPLTSFPPLPKDIDAGVRSSDGDYSFVIKEHFAWQIDNVPKNGKVGAAPVLSLDHLFKCNKKPIYDFRDPVYGAIDVKDPPSYSAFMIKNRVLPRITQKDIPKRRPPTPPTTTTKRTTTTSTLPPSTTPPTTTPKPTTTIATTILTTTIKPPLLEPWMYGVIGGVVGLLLLCLIIGCCICRRRRKSRYQQMFGINKGTDQSEISSAVDNRGATSDVSELPSAVSDQGPTSGVSELPSVVDNRNQRKTQGYVPKRSLMRPRNDYDDDKTVVYRAKSTDQSPSTASSMITPSNVIDISKKNYRPKPYAGATNSSKKVVSLPSNLTDVRPADSSISTAFAQKRSNENKPRSKMKPVDSSISTAFAKKPQ